MRWEEERIAVPEPDPVSIEHTGVQVEQVLLNQEVQTSLNNFFPHVLHDAAAQFPSALISPAVRMHSRAASPFILIDDDITQAPKDQVCYYLKINLIFICHLIYIHIFSMIAGGCTSARYKRSRFKPINRSSPYPRAKRF
jgi:hypothetical protein